MNEYSNDEAEDLVMDSSGDGLFFESSSPNSVHIPGRSDLPAETEDDSLSLVTENATAQANVTHGIYFPPDMITFGAVCMILMTSAGIVGNFISFCALYKSKKLNRITTAFILNLCMGNLLMACGNFTKAIAIYRTHHWNAGDETCKVYNILVFFFSSAVMFSINAITLNRYVLIAHPGFYCTMYRMRNTAIIISFVWVFSAAMTLLPHFELWGRYGYDPKSGECAVIDRKRRTKIYSFIVKYFISFVLLLLCYAKIFYVVRKSEKNTGRLRRGVISYLMHLNDRFWLGDRKNGPGSTSNRPLRNMKEWRLFQMILVIFLCFILCFVPVTAMKISRKEKEYPRLYIVCHLGIHLSNVVNPIIYVVMNEEYRKAYKEFFSSIFCPIRVNNPV